MLASLSFAEYLVTNDISARTARSWVPTGNDALVSLRSTDETDFAGEKRVPEDPRGPEGPPSGPPHIAALHRLAAYSLYRSATRPVCASPG